MGAVIFSLNRNDLEAICQIRATLYATVEFDLKFLPVPVTAYTQHFHIAFAVKSVKRSNTNGTRHSQVVQ